MKLDEDIFGNPKPPQGVDGEIFAPTKPMRIAMPEQMQAPDENFLQAMLIGTGRTFDRLGAGVKQMYYGATGNDQAAAELKAAQDENTRLYQPLKQARPWATGIGESLPAMALPLGGAGTAGQLALRAALGNAALGASEYGSVGERALNATRQGLGGAVGSMIGSAVGNLIPRVGNLQPVIGNPTPAQKAAATVLDNSGVPLSIGERTGSRVARGLEDAMNVIPATATKAQAFKDAQQQALNQAAAKLAGVTDQGLTAITPDIAQAARRGAGQAIGDIAERNTLAIGQPVMKSMLDLQNEVQQYAAPEVARTVTNRIKQAFDKLETDAAGNVTMPGRTYRELQSAIGKQMKSASGDLKAYLGTLRDALRDGMNQSISAADKAAWESANKTYRNAITLEDVAARSPLGNISPASLFQAGKKGTPEMRDLGAAASALIRPLPSSGTAERSLAINMLTNPGGALMQGVATLPAIGVQNLMTAAAKRPQGMLNLPEWMLRGPGIAGGLGGGLLGSAGVNLYGQ